MVTDKPLRWLRSCAGRVGALMILVMSDRSSSGCGKHMQDGKGELTKQAHVRYRYTLVVDLSPASQPSGIRLLGALGTCMVQQPGVQLCARQHAPACTDYHTGMNDDATAPPTLASLCVLHDLVLKTVCSIGGAAP